MEVLPPTRLLLEIARKEGAAGAHARGGCCSSGSLLAALGDPRARRPDLQADRGGGARHRPAAPGRRQRLGVGAALAGNDRDRAPRSSTSPRSQGRPIALLATAEGRQPAARRRPTPADGRRSASLRSCRAPTPPTTRRSLPALADAAKATPFGGVAWLSDGLGGGDVAAFADVHSTTRIGAPTVGLCRHRATDLSASSRRSAPPTR